MKKLICLVLSAAMFFGSCFATFSDISGHWAEAEIEALAEQGIIKGYEDNTIRPQDTVTRGEFSALLARFLHIDQTFPNLTAFKDTPDTWYGGYVEALAARKILFEAEYPGGVYDGDAEITRMEIVKMLVRALDLNYAVKTNCKDTEFADNASISFENSGFVNLAVFLKLINGDSQGNANMDSYCTRAEGFALISRMAAAKTIAIDQFEPDTPKVP